MPKLQKTIEDIRDTLHNLDVMCVEHPDSHIHTTDVPVVDLKCNLDTAYKLPLCLPDEVE